MAAKRQRLAQRRKACGYTQEEFGDALTVDRTTVQRWERGEVDPHPHQRPKLAKLLQLTSKELDELLTSDTVIRTAVDPRVHREVQADDDELESWELARRVESSDVGQETLGRLETAFDELATAYPKVPPQEILQQVRKYSSYVTRLLDARKTLAEHRRLLVFGGWLSLLGATVHIDLKQNAAASARLQTAAILARQAEHPEIEAWCYETEAWRVLTDGNYVRAIELSQIAQGIAPAGSSAQIQSTAQEGRARARLGQAKETYSAIDRVQSLSASLVRLDDPEHHYQYDPAKSLSYTATTLAWLGDPVAEQFARAVIAQLDPHDDIAKWPRRVASANIDLALVLVAGNRLDEACDAARKAILSGRVVPSNHWRALEVVKSVEAGQLPEAADLRDAYESLGSRHV
ncbi:helix-turn-helix transcriptional regulator [Actinacidiphila paucisporea]|uniref:DNA-binding transcriptional regulator, XRE-family HTH domain n=1 Tax=Actinacidiphila paucisporea TaxID=310782 RepID=A0A1M6XSQ2_9ACTN|nr:helix-turn-helix transcriptional regulator [Actinacidiphila paucisporea]SHL09050.1 DNA-binding transcriptional regulator, XRE-family HTH domain [Actinacidiphila paucisporea]